MVGFEPLVLVEGFLETPHQTGYLQTPNWRVEVLLFSLLYEDFVIAATWHMDVRAAGSGLQIGNKNWEKTKGNEESSPPNEASVWAWRVYFKKRFGTQTILWFHPEISRGIGKSQLGCEAVGCEAVFAPMPSHR